MRKVRLFDVHNERNSGGLTIKEIFMRAEKNCYKDGPIGSRCNIGSAHGWHCDREYGHPGPHEAHVQNMYQLENGIEEDEVTLARWLDDAPNSRALRNLKKKGITLTWSPTDK